MSTLLKVEEVSKAFGEFYALNGCSLTIPEKRIDLLIGPNGSGKTTLLNCISGVLGYTGKIWFNGIHITGKKPWEIVHLGIGRTFQIPAPFKDLTVAENLLVCSKNHKGENISTSIFKTRWEKQEKELVEKSFRILKSIDLESKYNALASQLSGGQLKLLELGRLLMLGCTLLLMDEPISGVNPVLAHRILSQIQKIRDDLGTSFLIIEHRLDIAMQYAEVTHVMSGGRVMLEGSPKEISDSDFYKVFL